MRWSIFILHQEQGRSRESFSFILNKQEIQYLGCIIYLNKKHCVSHSSVKKDKLNY